MTDLRKTPSSRRPALSAVWLGGLCWLSSLGIADLPASAQTASDPVVPGAADLLQIDPTLAPSAPEDLAPLPEPAAEAPSRSVDLELSTPGAPEQSAVEGSPGSSETSGNGVESSAPGLAPDPAPLVSPNLATQAESAFGQQGSGFGNFIDSTPYSLGATDNPNVVLSERSTGCETMVQPGQTVASVCASASQAYADAAGGYGGSYSGDFGLSVVYGGRTVPSGKDFYNLTVRPPARLSLGNVGLLFPLTMPAAITSAFGWRIHPVLESSRFHSGTDLGAPQGTPVLAAFSGKVAVADFMGGYGLTVVLQHQNGSEETLYGHLSEIFVKPGETVKQGEVIGRVGNTGLSTGPHLHFEFRKQTPEGWVVMDPGGALEYALSQFVNALKLGLAYPPKLTIQASSFTKALEMVQAREGATNPVELSVQPSSQVDPVASD